MCAYSHKKRVILHIQRMHIMLIFACIQLECIETSHTNYS